MLVGKHFKNHRKKKRKNTCNGCKYNEQGFCRWHNTPAIGKCKKEVLGK